MIWADLRGPVIVTGTDIGVGKTVVTAAMAASATAAGRRVAVVKPAQVGTAVGRLLDTAVVAQLAAPATAVTLITYPASLSPLLAAQAGGADELELYSTGDAVRGHADEHDLVLVEGTGGLLAPMGRRPSGETWTMADLAVSLGAPAVVVARAGAGTVNHASLTLEALERRAVPARVVFGDWPAAPHQMHWSNLSMLLPQLAGAVPADAGTMEPGVFRRSAPGWLTPQVYGVLDDWRAWAEEIG